MLRRLISEREEELPHSTIGKLISIAEEGRGVLSLGAGELDYPSPAPVLRAAKKAITDKETHYSPPQGREDLREAVVKKLRKENNIKTTPENIIITTGSTEGILLALMSTIDPGEAALLPDPGFLAYKPAVEVLNGMPLSFGLREDFSYDIESMEEVNVPEKSRVLIINTPSNPTGAVLGRKNLEEIAGFAVENDLLVISDEAYEKFVYSGKHISIGSLNGMEERTLTLHSFSKSYAMPGFRLGYAAGPEALIRAMTKLHIFTTICAPTMSQVAALAAMKSSGATERMVRDYGRRRKTMVKRLQGIEGFSCNEPKGAFYAFPKFRWKMSSLKLAGLLLEKARVAVVPGTEFGRRGEGHLRLSYATPLKKMEAAMDRIGKFTKRL